MARATRDAGSSDEMLSPQRLARRRRALGLSQQALGNALGVPRNTVARWERGDTKIARPDWLTTALASLDSQKGACCARSMAADSASSKRKVRLPAELSSFVGRECE